LTDQRSFASQEGFSARFEWGVEGLQALLPHVTTVVIVDVLSFSTSVDIATSHGARVYPARWRDERAANLANKLGAVLAGSPETHWSLRPSSLVSIPDGTRLVLPSPNGATLTAIAAESNATVLIGCLRNAGAIGALLRASAGAVAVIAAGERWQVTGGSLRPAAEDLIGAGAILHAMGGTPSPEARAAIGAFESVEDNLLDTLWDCASGRELIGQGHPADVALAAEYAVSEAIPRLRTDGFIDARQDRHD
jgi:2-phosphosulfolactate phosphatase